MKFQKKLAGILVLLLLLAGCSTTSNISGFISGNQALDGSIEVTNSDLKECGTFIENGVEKSCAVFKEFSCEYCDGYIEKLKKDQE